MTGRRRRSGHTEHDEPSSSRELACSSSQSQSQSLNSMSDFDEDHASLSIATQRSIYVTPHPPVGFKNWGNTCYANAALQCLLSTALASALLDPRCFVVFRRYASNVKLLESQHQQALQTQGASASANHLNTSGSGGPEVIRDGSGDATSVSTSSTKRSKLRRKSEACQWLTDELVLLCQQYRAPTTSFFGKIEPVDPGSITRNVTRLSKCLQVGRQEDAHEFLRSLLGTLVMDGQNRKLSALFDGLLESAVTCCTCRRSSLTRDRYMDLSLEIDSPDCKDLLGALRLFTRTETLSKDNLVDCDHCECRRQVTKGLRLATAPTILVLHLKRFSYDRYGKMIRLAKHIAFPQTLSIAEFMSLANKSIPRLYELVGVLVHLGKSCNRGHYIAYVKSGSVWYRASDNQVEQVSESVVMKQGAYILMYQVEGVKKHRAKGLVKLRPGDSSEQAMRATETNPGFSVARLLTVFESCGVSSVVSNCWGHEQSSIVTDGLKQPKPTPARTRSLSSSDTERQRHFSKSWSSKSSKESKRHAATHKALAEKGPSSQDTIPLQKTMSESSSSSDNPAKVRKRTSSPTIPVSFGPDKHHSEVKKEVRLVISTSSGNLKERSDAAAKAYERSSSCPRQRIPNVRTDLSNTIHITTPTRNKGVGLSRRSQSISPKYMERNAKNFKSSKSGASIPREVKIPLQLPTVPRKKKDNSREQSR